MTDVSCGIESVRAPLQGSPARRAPQASGPGSAGFSFLNRVSKVSARGVSGHGFSRAAWRELIAAALAADQGLKPSTSHLPAAWLKPCPDTPPATDAQLFMIPHIERLRLFPGNFRKNRRVSKPRNLCATSISAKAHGEKSARRGYLLLAGIVGCLALVCAGCGSKEAAAPEPVVTVQAGTVQQKMIQQIVTADAVLYPLHQADIVPKISAPVRKFYVNRGTPVKAGELVAVLENKDLSAAVVQSKGTFDQAQASYETALQMSLPAAIQTAELDVRGTRQAMQAAELVYKSRLKLYQSGAMARNLMDQSQVAYVQARNQYDIALAHLNALQAVGKAQQIKAAKGQLATAQGSYLAALAQFDYSQIRSPINGLVTDRPLYEGEMATAGTPLMTVMDISHVEARAHISPQQAYLLRVGDRATIFVGSGEPGTRGKVAVVSPALDPNSTTVQVWVDAPNPGDRLKPGATVSVSMVARTVKNALLVPSEAILTASDGSTSVMVVGPRDHAHQTDVKTGIREDDEVQIVSGLKAGERIVTEGAYGLPDGTKVKF
jgi:HlyD family secretion protein